jgi:hypothetical protein
MLRDSMPHTRSRFLLFASIACCLALSTLLLARARESQAVDPSLTAHEWGTFTSIAGAHGQAVEWSPLTGSTDLPTFVEHFRSPTFKLGLRGTVRMETPVLYFYSSREETVSVKVSFSKGILTEWYPHASAVGPAPNLLKASLFQGPEDGSIAWDSVTIAPTLRAEFPNDRRDNQYYAARLTSSTPLRVSTPAGQQHEKFLFYRGVASFAVPISATLDAAGHVRVRNQLDADIPNTISFERRGAKVGYRIGGAVKTDSTLDPPELTSSGENLARDLEGMLVTQGLYQDEAHAMLETWRGSWFEEGSRLLYIVPEPLVNQVLPLSIHPAPAQIRRVFVGRIELVTSATRDAVEQALATHETATLQKYSRFLEPILATMVQQERNPDKARQLNAHLGSYYSTVIAQNLHPQ